MATVERNRPGSYYTDRSYYGHYPADKEVIVERKKPKFGRCAYVVAAIFIVFIIILIICLVIFFTWGAAYFTGPAATGVTVSPGLQVGSGELLEQQNSGQFKGVHFDLDLPRYVLNALKNGQPKICILDTAFLADNYKELYTKEHIPGARHFDIAQILKTLPDGTAQLAHPLEFQSYARSLGIDNDCHVIAYDHSEQSNSVVTATFVWWLFKLYGFTRVTVMNGGLKEWKKFTANEPSFQPISGPAKAVQQGDLKAGWLGPKWIITYPDVLAKVKDRKTQIVDSRNPNEYSGVIKPSDAKESGRIKYAVNVPTSDIINDEGGLKTLTEIKEFFSNKKVDPAQPAIAYDNSALMASALYFSMNQAGYEVRLYDGGWKEWAEKAPVEYKERGT